MYGPCITAAVASVADTPECLPQACTAGRRPRGRPKTCWSDDVTQQALEPLGIFLEELDKFSGGKFGCHCCPMILAWLIGRKEMYGWMKDVSMGNTTMPMCYTGLLTACVCMYMQYRYVGACVHACVYGIIKITALVSINIHNSTALLIFTAPFLLHN